MLAAGFFNRLHAIAREFVRGEVGSCVFHPDEWAEVGDKVVCEKVMGGIKEFGEESPETAPGNFGALAIKAGDGTLGVLGVGFVDRAGDVHPIANVRDFTKGNASLGHPVWSGVHAKEKNLLGTTAKAFQVIAVTVPGILQWIVGVGDWIRKGEATEFLAEVIGSGDEGIFAHEEGA
jgi:hypothetical protein